MLAAAALAYRVAKLKFGVPDFASNFSPWMALAFAGSLVMPRSIAWWVLPAALMLCDAVVGTGQMGSMWMVYACYGMAALAGGLLRKRSSVMLTMGGTTVASAVFYFLTNTQAWLADPVYAKTVGGWIQALSVGNPAYPPTWVFGLSTLTSDLGFAALLVVAYNSEAILRQFALLPHWRKSVA